MTTHQTAITIGLMSGTSLDGVDGVIARFDAEGQPTLLGRASQALPDDLKRALLLLNSPGQNELHRAALASNALMSCYASVVDELRQHTGLSADQISAIGAHGQTVRHQPELGYTIQLNAPALLAELTGIAVVADLRSRDVAAGGQGAPLVPACHQALFGTGQTRIILNLGGIANVTVLRAHHPVIGFDTGPANMLLDGWCQRHTGMPFDADGAWASRGRINEGLLSHLMASEPWFELAPPKSTGRDLFGLSWLDQRLTAFPDLDPVDVQATLTALTAVTVIDALNRLAIAHAPIFVCGGGARNAALMLELQSRWPAKVESTASLGVDPQDMEALAFAWLAWAHLQNKTGNLQEVTGARGARVLGAYWPS